MSPTDAIVPVWHEKHLRAATRAAGVALWSWKVETDAMTICSRLQSEKNLVRLQSNAIGRVQVAEPGGGGHAMARPWFGMLKETSRQEFQKSEPRGVKYARKQRRGEIRRTEITPTFRRLLAVRRTDVRL